MNKAIIVFIRKPELGKVKTRLAATVGNEKALEIYIKLLQHTNKILTATGIDIFVFYTEAIDENDNWQQPNFKKFIQAHGDLGVKIKKAFETVFSKGYNQVFIIGSDCYELTTNILLEAFEGLQTKEVVIGKAVDGGYYLLGMKELHSFLFDNKEWSTSTIATDTLNDCEQHNLSVFQLPILNDVDEEKDVPKEWL